MWVCVSSGLYFPRGFHVTCEVKVASRSVVPDSLQPHGLESLWDSPGQNTGVSSLSLLQGNLPNPGIEPRSPALQADSSPAKPQGKSHKTLNKYVYFSPVNMSLSV